MYCLGIDTSSAVGTVAISRDGAPVCRLTISADMTHSRTILETMGKVTAEAHISMQDIGIVAVGVGPGSYTGVRVGIAFAKGIAFGLKIPVVGVCSFESMLFTRKEFDGAICTLVDAKMGGTYWAAYRVEGAEIITIKTPMVSRTEEIQFECGSKTLFLSPEIEKFMEALGAKFSPRTAVEFKEAFPDAAYAAVLGEKRLLEKGRHPEIKLEPYYLRPSMAEMTSSRTRNEK